MIWEGFGKWVFELILGGLAEAAAVVFALGD